MDKDYWLTKVSHAASDVAMSNFGPNFGKAMGALGVTIREAANDPTGAGSLVLCSMILQALAPELTQSE
jgi:hypothetical protein